MSLCILVVEDQEESCIHRRGFEPMEHPMQKLNDLSRSLAPLEPDGTLIAVIEMSQSSWLVAGIVPGVEGTQHRGPRYPRIERSRIARAPARQDRPARHRAAQTRLSRLAARRA